MDYFLEWMTKPMSKQEIKIWFMANNIIPELNNLFQDFCFSFYFLLKETYLGDMINENIKNTFIVMTEQDNLSHFKWCWLKTIENFEKENIFFKFKEQDYDYFESFFMEIFYEQKNQEIRDSLNDFLKQLFNTDRPMSKSDLEMYTDVYKVLERSLQIQ
jgi:hypothetical protein